MSYVVIVINSIIYQAAQWAWLGAETAHDQHVDAHACRLHLSVAVVPLGLELPWVLRETYMQCPYSVA